MDENELKACPWCGSEVEFYMAMTYGNGERGTSRIMCRKCHNSMADHGKNSDATVVEKWNTRPLEDALTAEVTALRDRVAELEDEARWVSVEEGLPEKSYNDRGDEVLAHLGYPYNRVTAMKFIRYDDGDYEFFTGGYGAPSTRWTEHVIEWRPLPTPPEAENE